MVLDQTQLILIGTLFSFLTTLIATPYAIRYFRYVKLTSTDIHKKDRPLLPHSAGVPIAAGLVAGLLVYIFLNVFANQDSSSLVTLFAALTSILIITFSGLIDDINTTQSRVAGHIEGKRGLKAWQKPLLTIPAAFPLMAIMAGTSTMVFPVFGAVNFGILYPFLVVPLGVLVASNMVNMLGGYNGIEISMGIVYTFSLGMFSLLNSEFISAAIFLITFASVVAMLKFNFYPAKILPGDSTTYVLGAVVAAGTIVGNIERAAIIVMFPFIVQGILKFISYLKFGRFASDLGILQKDGTIKSKYNNSIYSWIHLLLRIRPMTEKQIVLSMVLVQIAFSVIPFLSFFKVI